MKRLRFPASSSQFENFKATAERLWGKPIDGHLPHSRVLWDGRDMLMLGGHSYHGLHGDEDVKNAAKLAIDTLGTGSTNTPALPGKPNFHKRIEALLSHMWKREAAVLYPSKYAANVSLLSFLTGTDDAILIDQRAPRSLFHGAALSKASTQIIGHNNINQFASALKCTGSARNRIVVVSGLYPIDGSVCPLPELVALCKEFDAHLLVDEAHSLGTLGHSGMGTEEYFGLAPGSIDFRVGSLSNAIPASGGFIACSQDVADFLIHSRNTLPSGSIPFSSLAAAEIALHKLIEHNEWVDELQRKADLFRTIIEDAGVPTEGSRSCIIPVLSPSIAHVLKLTSRLFEEGIHIQPLISASDMRPRIRANICRTMTYGDLIYAAETIATVHTQVSESR